MRPYAHGLAPNAAFLQQMRECPSCGLFQALPPVPAHAQACCMRCGNHLRRGHVNAMSRALALSTASLVLYLIAVFAPFISVIIVGQQRQTTMVSLPSAFVADDFSVLGILVFLTTIVFPFAKITSLLMVLLGLRTANPPAFLRRLFALYVTIGHWAMIEVFLLGVFVAFTRLGAIATVQTGTALYAVGALMLTMVGTDVVLDRDEVWTEMEQRGLVPPPGTAPNRPLIGCQTCHRVSQEPAGAACSRCGTKLQVRRPNSISRTWALLAAAVILYLPANLYPVLTLVRLQQGNPSTILGGARELLEAGMWPLALLVFVASVAVPLLKLLSLAVMLIATQRGSAWRLRDRTRLYHLVEFIGRWSMIDVFMLATLVGLVRDGQIAFVTPGLGAVCFASVVVLTMIAAMCFDPRLMWDVADEAAARAPAPRPSQPTEPKAA